MNRDILVIGAGIVGICTAALLAEEGFAVTVLDRSGIAEETSKGNAAALAFTDILPLASPKIMRRAPRWLFDPLGPLSIRPAYAPRLVPWLWRFWKASLPAAVEASVKAQSTLMRLAETEMTGLAARAGADTMIRHDGSLELYESESEFRQSLPGWEKRTEAGIAFEHVRGSRLAELQPGLSRQFVAGTFVPGWKIVDEPQLYARKLFDYARAKGVTFERAEVIGLRPGMPPEAMLTDGTTRTASRIVLAAGAWSKRLLAGTPAAGIPLDTERGYNTTLPSGAFDLKRQIIFGGHGFVITPLSTGLRVGGAVEFGGLDLPPNYARSKAMLDKATRFLPGLKAEGGTEWMGFRPSLPDSLPAAGTWPGMPGLIFAFGNGHLGLTQSAAMGRIVGWLATDKKPDISLSPFRPDRFS